MCHGYLEYSTRGSWRAGQALRALNPFLFLLRGRRCLRWRATVCDGRLAPAGPHIHRFGRRGKLRSQFEFVVPLQTPNPKP